MSTRPVEINLLRYVPGTSVVHRLWAGTKLLAVAALSLTLSLQPTWPAIGLACALVAAAIITARIPLGAAPRLPRWFWIGLGIGGGLALTAGGAPDVHVAGFSIGLGGLEQWARFTVLGAVLVIAAFVVGWTTPLAEVAPALARLGAPLRRLRLPVDELVAVVALSIRCLPLLIDELRTLVAARRLRHPDQPVTVRHGLRELHDILAAAIVVSVRRAGEMADAIEARGGLGTIADSPARPGLLDLVAGFVVVAVAVVAYLV